MAIRGSPAKGVDWDDRCVGSNPTFSAKQRGGQFALLFAYQKETWDLNGHGSEWIASGDPEPCPRPAPQRRSNPTPAFTQVIVGTGSVVNEAPVGLQSHAPTKPAGANQVLFPAHVCSKNW